MKNILIAVLMFVSNYCTAQIYVNQIDVNKFDYQYLELWEHFNKQSGKFYAMVDYGQNATKSDQGGSYKVGERNGEPKKFNSSIAILNFMYKNGWELDGIKTTGDISSYILKRIPKMEKEDEKDAGTAEQNEPTEDSPEEEGKQ